MCVCDNLFTLIIKSTSVFTTSSVVVEGREGVQELTAPLHVPRVIAMQCEETIRYKRKKTEIGINEFKSHTINSARVGSCVLDLWCDLLQTHFFYCSEYFGPAIPTSISCFKMFFYFICIASEWPQITGG